MVSKSSYFFLTPQQKLINTPIKIQYRHNRLTDYGICYLAILLLCSLFCFGLGATAASKNSSGEKGNGSPTGVVVQPPRSYEEEIRLNDRNDCSSKEQEVNSLKRDYISTCAATGQNNCQALISQCYPDGTSTESDGVWPRLTQIAGQFLGGGKGNACPQLTGSDYASAKSEITDKLKDAKREVSDAQKDLFDRQTENERSKNDAQADQDKAEKDASDDIAKLKEDQQEAIKNAADEARKVQKEMMGLTSSIKGKSAILAQKASARIAATQLMTDEFIRNGCLQDLVDARKKYLELMGPTQMNTNGQMNTSGNAKNIYDQQKRFLEVTWETCMQKGLQSRLIQNQQAMAEEAQLRQEIQDAQQSITMLNDQLNQDKMNLNTTIQNYTNKEAVIKTDLYKQAMNLQNKVNTLAQDTYRQSQVFLTKQAQANSEMIQLQRDLQELGVPPPRGATETISKAYGKYGEYKEASDAFQSTCRSYIKSRNPSNYKSPARR